MEVSKPEIINYIQKAKNGKQSAFKFLLDTYWNKVIGFQLKRVKNEYEAEDISIETFAKAFDKIETFDEKYEFATWLIAISKNIQIDKSRKKTLHYIVIPPILQKNIFRKLQTIPPLPKTN